MGDINEKQELQNTPKSPTKDIEVKLEQGTLGEDHAITRDGYKLHPQPTSDPLDPLNFSKLQKNSVLAIVMFLYGITLSEG